MKQGDARSLDDVMTDDFMNSFPHPWLVIEDSAHLFETTLAVLRYFDPRLVAGDYMVVEDGVVSYLSGKRYRQYEGGPNLAIKQFLAANGERYFIDTELCDYFGSELSQR